MKRISMIITVFVLLIIKTQTYAAGFKLYGYSTRKQGEVEIVYFNNYYAKSDLMQEFFGGQVPREGHFSHSLEIEYGFTKRWTVSAYLDLAEDMALRKIPMTMQDWETRLNRFIEATDREILQNAGKVTAEIAKAHAETEFEKYRIIQDRMFESDFDRMLRQLEYKDDE